MREILSLGKKKVFTEKVDLKWYIVEFVEAVLGWLGLHTHHCDFQKQSGVC